MGPRRVCQADLFGRDRDVDSAVRALQGDGCGLLLAGEPGVGKTSVARAALARLSAEEDSAVLWLIAAAPEPAIPFGAFAPFVPDVGGMGDRQPDPFFLLQTLRKALLERASGQPLVIGIDDAHRLDGHSATLLYQLVAAREARVVLTARTGAGGPAALRSLWKEELVERIDLEPLGRDDSVALGRSLLGDGPLGGELEEALWQASLGNPLYLRELLVAGRRSGHVAERDGLWRLTGELTVGPRLAELIRERLDAAGEDRLPCLEVLAFSGPLPLPVAERLVPADHLAGLQKIGLLAVERSGRELSVRLGHPLFAELLREQLPARRSAQLAGMLADALEEDGRLADEIVRVVGWRLDAGQDVAADLLGRASVRAAEHQDWSRSAQMAGAAVEAGGGLEAALALAEAHRALGRYPEALAALGDERGCGDDQSARVAVLRAVVLALGLGRFDAAEQELRQAAATITAAPVRGCVEAVGAGLLTYAGRPAEAVSVARRLLDRPGHTARSEFLARVACALGLVWCGQPDDALLLLADAPEDGSPAALGDPPISVAAWLSTSWTKLTRLMAYALTGRVDDMERLAAGDYRLAVGLGNRQLQARAAGQLGWAALLKGSLPLAVSRFREATTDVGATTDSPGSRAHALIGLAEALAESGDLPGAVTALEAARPAAELSGTLAPRWQVAAARLEAADGAVGSALRRLEETAQQARDRSLVAYEVMALHASVRLGSGAAAARLAELEALAVNPLVTTMAAHARVMTTRAEPGGHLDEVAEAYANQELRLFAAETAAQACQAHRRAGEHRRATASANRAYFFLGAPDGCRPLALSMAMAPPELTRREREVSGLAARGMSSSAIANRLCLSVRTVDTHLARAYAKLGIGSRAELAAILLSSPDPVRDARAG